MEKEKQKTYEQDVIGDGVQSLQKVIAPHKEEGGRGVKYALIGISAAFLFVMLVLPLAVVISNAVRDGWTAF